MMSSEVMATVNSFVFHPELASVVLVSLPGSIELQPLFGLSWNLLLIPLISGIIGYITNWVGIRLLFYPVGFVGFSFPPLRRLVPYLPQRIQQIPGVLQGNVGWEGIIPSRAGKMGSIAVDKGIAKLGSEREFYEEFDPDKISEHLMATVQDDLREMVDEIAMQEQPELWRNTPRTVREGVYTRVEAHLSGIVDSLTDEIGEHVEDLLDVKMMVIDHLDENPELVNRIFLEVGDEELKFIVNSGFLLGGFLGIFTIPLFVLIDAWWILPVAGVLVGYCTNWVALKIIFLPYEERKIGPFRLQGLFIKRQPEVSETYSSIIADDIITMENIGDNLLQGRQADRTHNLIRTSVRPVVDDALGAVSPAVHVMAGADDVDQMREVAADQGVEFAAEALKDPEFSQARSEAIRELLSERMKVLPPTDYALMLRSAFKEDEWLLILIGAFLGFIAGWLQLLLVTAI
jgi:uncharacterized membrane protein YheB (UPF0754 family)